ncbi:hypothetical protein IWW50_001446 [Coemansia erecta]|nr:hypothetical protein IWW50_001446 [Coemansia erecta]
MSTGGLQGAAATRVWMYNLVFFRMVFAWSPAWRSTVLRLRFVPHITRDWQVWRLVTTVLGFATTTELLAALLIVYQLRIIERLFGTRKYVAFMFVACVVGQTLSMLALCTVWWLLPARVFAATNVVAGGPLVAVFACLVQYYLLVPSKHMRVLGVSVGDKWMTYVVAANLLRTSAVVPALAGIAAGAVYTGDMASLKQWRFPRRAETMAARLVAAVQPAVSRRPEQQVQRELVERLLGMFPAAGHEQAVQALQLAAGDPDRAVNILLGGH